MKFRKIASLVLPVIIVFFTMYSCINKGSSHKDPEVVAKIEKEFVKKEEVNEYYSGLENGFIDQYGEDYKESDDFKQIYLDLVNQYVEQRVLAVSYTHLTLPTIRLTCRSRWSPYH